MCVKFCYDCNDSIDGDGFLAGLDRTEKASHLHLASPKTYNSISETLRGSKCGKLQLSYI